MFDVRRGLLGVVEHWHVFVLVFVGYCCVVAGVVAAVLLVVAFVVVVVGWKLHYFF